MRRVSGLRYRTAPLNRRAVPPAEHAYDPLVAESTWKPSRMCPTAKPRAAESSTRSVRTYSPQCRRGLPLYHHKSSQSTRTSHCSPSMAGMVVVPCAGANTEAAPNLATARIYGARRHASIPNTLRSRQLLRCSGHLGLCARSFRKIVCLSVGFIGKASIYSVAPSLLSSMLQMNMLLENA